MEPARLPKYFEIISSIASLSAFNSGFGDAGLLKLLKYNPFECEELVPKPFGGEIVRLGSGVASAAVGNATVESVVAVFVITVSIKLTFFLVGLVPRPWISVVLAEDLKTPPIEAEIGLLLRRQDDTLLDKWAPVSDGRYGLGLEVGVLDFKGDV